MKTKFTYSISITSLFLGILFIMTGFENAESDKTLKETSSGELNFTVRTVTANGNYAPKHVLAIWVEYENDFVKTRLLRGNARKQYLYTWKAASDYNVVDAITGATLTSHTTHSVTWDCLDLDGNIVPDGEYTIWVEFTEKHAQGPLFSIPFSKGPDAINLTPSDETYFKDIELDFTPFTAEFIASTQEVCQDEELTFTDESVNATEWDWDFGDGASPAAANTEGPHTVSYSTSGFKTVSLTINGSLTETKENYVEILSQPSADFEFGGTFYHIDFMNNSIDANSYTWDFGDGNTSTEENPSHEYALDGSYMVTLHAINSICFDEITYEVQVPMVGVNELREADLINISPNPNSGTFTINKNELGKINSISIRDMVGKETSFSKSESNSIISIDMEKNAPGIYFLMIKTDNKVYSIKFITR